MVASLLAISGNSMASAATEPDADLAVRLDAVGTILLPGATFTVYITNNGPAPLTAATVVVGIDTPGWGIAGTAPCQANTDGAGMTCSFGALAVGATASVRPTVYYGRIPGRTRTILATATRTTSTPNDPNPANDTDPATCWYSQPIPGQTWPPAMVCGNT